MAKPMKRSGWNQGILTVSATQKESLGALRILQDGRKFRYAKAGSSALSAGNANAAAAIAAAVLNQACASAHSQGDYTVTETITAPGAAIAENYFADGFLAINDADGEGHHYKIVASTPVSATGTSITVVLEDPLRTALVAAASEFTLVHNPEMEVVETTTEESLFTGVAPVAVPAGYFFWNQTGGMASVLTSGTPAIGTVLTLSSTSGALQAIATPLAIDAAYCVGVAALTVGVNGEYKPVDLRWD